MLEFLKKITGIWWQCEMRIAILSNIANIQQLMIYLSTNYVKDDVAMFKNLSLHTFVFYLIKVHLTPDDVMLDFRWISNLILNHFLERSCGHF